MKPELFYTFKPKIKYVKKCVLFTQIKIQHVTELKKIKIHVKYVSYVRNNYG